MQAVHSVFGRQMTIILLITTCTADLDNYHLLSAKYLYSETSLSRQTHFPPCNLPR